MPGHEAAAGPRVETVARRKRTALSVAIVVLVSLLQVLTQYLANADRARLLTHLVFLVVAIPPLMWIFSAGFARATRRQIGTVPMIFAGVLVAGVLGAAINFGVRNFAESVSILRAHRPPEGARALLFGVLSGQFELGLWALAFVLPFAAEDARVRSLEAEKLRLEAEKLRTAAELARVRAHLEPHFLLNTLNAIAGLVTDDPHEARRLLVCLGDLLRDALRDDDEMQTLDDQVSWLRRYAEILEARHPGNLVFQWQIAEGARGVMVPRLLLQPLVENAVKHGALRRASGGEVTVRAEVVWNADETTTKLVCTIEDNGPGMPDRGARSGAFGLHAVRRRLELKYMEQAQLRLESTTSGTRSIVELPGNAVPAGLVGAT